MRSAKILVFRLALLGITLIGIEMIGYLGMYLNSGSFDVLSNHNYFQIRAMLIGNKDPKMLPRYLTLPYLGYIPYPGYERDGVVQHNEDGYRGEKVPLKRSAKYRILCMGGSTTYGFGVALPDETYPAQLEKILNKYIKEDKEINDKYDGVEIINAGLEAGNSAEELEQYLAKYRYYHADAVIIHSGINDAQLASTQNQNFQLDYTHSRRINFHLEPLGLPARWLLKSYFISFISIRLFYTDFTSKLNKFENDGDQTFCDWSHINIGHVIETRQYEFYPFYRNSRSLYMEIKEDSARLFILPCILNLNSSVVLSNESYKGITDFNIFISKLLSKESGGVNIPLDFDSLKDSSYWIGDDCHLNAKGEERKAEIVCPYIINAMKQAHTHRSQISSN
jgi:lysophospholipase L1-like esterase